MSTARDSYVTKNIRNVRPDIRDAVLNETVERDVTISDVVGDVLSGALAIPYEASGQPATGIILMPSTKRGQLNVFIPQEMAHRIWLASRSRGITESSLVQTMLAEHYGIDYEPVRRGGVQRRKASA